MPLPQLKPPPKILLAEDETLLRQLLSQRLADSIPGVVLTLAQSVEELKQLSQESFDVAVVDLTLADGSALGWVKDWSAAGPGRKAIVLTNREEDFILHGVFQSSVAGFVHKSDGLEFLEMAIRTVIAGGSFFSPKIQAMRTRLNSDPDFFAKILSVREQSILKHIGEGYSIGEIASLVGVKEATITDHRKNIMQKLNVHSQAELISYILAKGFVDEAPRARRT